MSFLAELTDLQQKAIADLANQDSQKAAASYSDYVHTSLQAMKRGIYNEFRRLVVAKPKLHQYSLQRTITVKTPAVEKSKYDPEWQWRQYAKPMRFPNPLLTGFRQTVANADAFANLVTIIRAEFPECIVTCSTDGSTAQLKINFTVFVGDVGNAGISN